METDNLINGQIERKRTSNSEVVNVALWVVAFLVLHLVLRMAVTPSLHSDDADLVVFDQSLEWGYHAQPPLYSWLLRGLTVSFGTNLFSLNLLRSILLGATALFLYLSLRQFLTDQRLIALGAVSGLAIPVLAWHAVTYLTHTLLLCAACMATFWAAVRVLKSGRWGDYLLLGAICGLGILSKYNFAVFGVSLFAAGLTITSIRQRLLSTRMLVATALAVVIFLPHLLWVLDHGDALRGEYAAKLNTTGEASIWYAAWQLAKNLLLLAAPTVALFAVSFPGVFKPSCHDEDLPAIIERWAGRYFVAVAGCYLLCVVVAQAGRFHERWLEPLFLMLPVCFLARAQRFMLPAWGFRRYARAMAVLAIVITAVRAGQLWLGSSHRGFIIMDYSYATAADELRAAVPDDAILVADDHGIGGNLAVCVSDLPCVAADQAAYRPTWASQRDEYVLLWQADDGEQIPARLTDYARDFLGIEPATAGKSNVLEVDPLFADQPPLRLVYQRLTRGTSVADRPRIDKAAQR